MSRIQFCERAVFVGILFVAAGIVACLPVARGAPKQNPSRTIILDVLRNSWNTERNETLVYLRVYSDGLVEAHSMRKVDFRDIRFAEKQLSDREMQVLKDTLSDPATAHLQPNYSRYWGNKDFGFRYTVTIHGESQKQLELLNFQPFLARKEGKPYPKQLEKLGCEIWRLRTEVTGEPLERDWLKGCTELGY